MTPPPWTPPPPDKSVAPEWAVTWGDLMSLLLLFFVLVTSYSTMDAAKYKAMAGSMRAAFGAGDGGMDSELRRMGLSGDSVSDALRREVESKLEALAASSGVSGPLQAVRTSEGLRVRVEGAVMFDLGSAVLRPDALPLLARLSPLMAIYPYTISVEGHTDDLPIQNQTYPSNWELSAARAGTVVRYLITRGGVPPSHLMAAGYADTHPILPNTSEGARANNRRVEFLLSRPFSSTPGN